MLWQKRIQPGEKVALKLTVSERKLILDVVMCLDEEYEVILRATPTDKPVMMTLDELDDFCGNIAFEANHTESKKLQKKLDHIFKKIQDLLGKYTDEEEQPEKRSNISRADTADAVNLSEWTALMLGVAEQSGIEPANISRETGLSAQDRMLLLNLLDSQEDIKKKLRDEGEAQSVRLSCKELAVICFAISQALLDAGAEIRERLRSIAAKIAGTLSSCLNAEAAEKVGRTRLRSRPRKPKGTPLLRLTSAQRQIVAALRPQLSDRLLLDTKNERSIEFSTSELTTIRKEATAAISHADNGLERNSLRHIIEKITALQERADAANRLYQFKITLLEIDPPIWRRIQIHDCTLDDLHFLIQAAMGWENCHLHQFEIDGRRYGDPELLDDGYEDFDVENSRKTLLSEIVPSNGKRFRFKYEYDFGDDWQHEIIFEGSPPDGEDEQYPLCLEGERACPPEDVGGTWGYQEYSEALADPSHERHEEFVEWRGKFNPERFEVEEVNRRVRGIQV